MSKKSEGICGVCGKSRIECCKSGTFPCSESGENLDRDAHRIETTIAGEAVRMDPGVVMGPEFLNAVIDETRQRSHAKAI